MKDRLQPPSQSLFSSFKRLRPFPIDEDSRFEKLSLLREYIGKKRSNVFEGQIISVYGDKKENNGIYIIISENGVFTEKRLSQTSELVEEISIVNSRIDALSDRVDTAEADVLVIKEDLTELDKKIDDAVLEINAVLSRDYATKTELEEVSSKLDSVQTDLASNYATKTYVNDAVDGAIHRIMGTIEDIDETIDTIIEIRKWIEDNGDILDTVRVGVTKLEGDLSKHIESSDKAISDLKAADTKLISDLGKVDSRVETLEKAGYITADEVIEIIGNTNLENVMKTMVIPFEVATGKTIRVIEDRNNLIEKGFVIQDIRIDIEVPTSKKGAKEFRVYFKEDGKEREQILPEDISLQYDAEMLEAIGEMPSLDILLDTSVKGSNNFNLNYYVKGDGIVIPRMEIHEGDALSGKVYINYFFYRK